MHSWFLTHLRLKMPKLHKAGLVFYPGLWLNMLQSHFLQTEVRFLHLCVRDSFRRLHSRSFQQITCLCVCVNLNVKAPVAFQPIVITSNRIHQISCPFPAVSHQQQGSSPTTFHLCFVWVTPQLHHVLLAPQTHTNTHACPCLHMSSCWVSHRPCLLLYANRWLERARSLSHSNTQHKCRCVFED